MNNFDTMMHITKQLYEKEDMTVMRPSIQLHLGGGDVYFFFYNVNIEGLGQPTKLLSYMQLKRPDGSDIIMYFTRPSLQSQEFKVYTLSNPNLPQLSRLNNNEYNRIFSWAVCGWYKSTRHQFPAGFDYERLHKDCKTLDESLFDRNYIIEQNCDFVPRPLHIMLFGNLNEL